MMDNKWEKIRKISVAAVFAVVILALSVSNIFYRSPEISISERRHLKTFPKDVVGTEFTNQFEEYALDNFIFRDEFRSIKAHTLFNVFMQKDNNGIYIVNGSAAKTDKLDEKSVSSAAEKINKMADKLPATSNIYYSIIPDKSYYMTSKVKYPAIDYARLEEIMEDKLNDNIYYIDIKNALSENSYYTTDLHWDQSKIIDVVKTLGDYMNFSDVLDDEFEVHELTPFYGVYYGQSALPLKAETLSYLTNPSVDNAKVQMLDPKTAQMQDGVMYDVEQFDGIDPYNIFLNGAQPLITIENPAISSDKELYIFRDSYTSSLAPLMTFAYKKITLIDLRYLASSVIDMFVEFSDNSDVLFLYSTQILNNSATMLVN